ncbi:hypothetical protein H072_5235 [Dactylellina haptotyla CBS 200.50]|uniref:Uncharacterized protein n=1 Tax=Dactylellina haptotyla (strain CBS 200.50) TaxID=1284197 RepID=S8BN63_DACHA|nr:hypothetical protein H072_5235 [Dactylellina haptotyla CBS 200.50]
MHSQSGIPTNDRIINVDDAPDEGPNDGAESRAPASGPISRPASLDQSVAGPAYMEGHWYLLDKEDRERMQRRAREMTGGVEGMWVAIKVTEREVRDKQQLGLLVVEERPDAPRSIVDRYCVQIFYASFVLFLAVCIIRLCCELAKETDQGVVAGFVLGSVSLLGFALAIATSRERGGVLWMLAAGVVLLLATDFVKSAFLAPPPVAAQTPVPAITTATATATVTVTITAPATTFRSPRAFL